MYYDYSTLSRVVKRRTRKKYEKTKWHSCNKRHTKKNYNRGTIPASIVYKSIAGRYRPVRVADGQITARYRFINNASWDLTTLILEERNLVELTHTVEPQWPKHLLDNRKLFETWVIRANEGKSWCQVREKSAMI